MESIVKINSAPDKMEYGNFKMQNIKRKTKKKKIKYQTLCCGDSLESSRSDDFNEYQQHRV